MDIWHYGRSTGILVGRAVADPNPLEHGQWLIPAYATTVRPPLVPPGCIAIFDGGLTGRGAWRIELKAVDDILQRLSPQLAHLVTVVDKYCRNADLDHAEATRLVLEAAEVTIGQATDSEELRAEAGALLQDMIGAHRAN